MSASLVGSEMCIRDSPAARAGHGTLHWQGDNAGSCPFPSSCLRRAPCPVSYTHLTLPTICSV
eukprot:955038-Alexandrium_andersonii.AAC.1